MIIRLFLYLTLPVLTVFTTAILLIHAQPVDNRAIHTLLNPEDCAAPCFMGIRPGVTTTGEAITLLKSQAWVASIEPQYSSGTTVENNPSWVAWDWKDDAPIWFYSASAAIFGHAGILETLDGIVENITVATNIPFGSIRLMLGLPPSNRFFFVTKNMARGIFSGVSLRYRYDFLESNIQMDAPSLCGMVMQLWFKPTSITFMEARQVPRSADDVHPIVTEVNNLKRDYCVGDS